VTGPPGDAPTADLSICGAFSCPYCYLASRRTDRLAATPITIGWQMVAPRLRLPAAGRPGGAGREVLQAELDAARELLLPAEQLPRRAPVVLPTTAPAVAGYAEAVGAGVADAVRGLLFDAYWLHGADIAKPEVLRRCWPHPSAAATPPRGRCVTLGYAVTLAGGPVTTQAYYRIRDWQDSWRQLGAGSPSCPDRSRIDAHRCPGPVQARRRRPRAEHRPARHRRRRSQPASGRRSTCRWPGAAFLLRRRSGSRDGRRPHTQGYIRPAITQTRQTRRRSCHLKAAHNSRHRHPRPPAITGAVATAKQTDQTLTHASGGGGSDRPVLPADARGATPPVGRLTASHPLAKTVEEWARR